MTDRELLELAAKAAGLQRCENYYTDAAGNHVDWNPLADDGDAMRLAVKLKFDIMQSGNIVGVYPRFPKSIVAQQPAGDDPYAATRRAIVRAAAEIGRNMK